MAALQALGIDTIALDVTKPESITSVKAEIERLTGREAQYSHKQCRNV
ncbi:hypothetical protein EUX98_g2699 [Antrodiella citrinella]|uniref:Uncharacterized protein n=1 Tax=Antrodiella citrinella TaxID=2447956 RepID=A0A4S4MZQ6_9APHY|nr:hypothetical protein EUX98_g2699 [Antrodiella citrinella]